MEEKKGKMPNKKNAFPVKDSLPEAIEAGETHYPPSCVKVTGLHLQLGEGGEYLHTPLEDVLRGLASAPNSDLGGAVRDISGGPVDYENKMLTGPRDMVVQIGGVTGSEAFGKDSYSKGFPPVISEHCQHTIFSAGGYRLMKALKEIVPLPKKK